MYTNAVVVLCVTMDWKP